MHKLLLSVVATIAAAISPSVAFAQTSKEQQLEEWRSLAVCLIAEHAIGQA